MLATASIQAAMTLQGLLLWAAFNGLRAYVGASSFPKLIGVGKAFASPPSEPYVRFSRIRLSSRWFPHRESLALS